MKRLILLIVVVMLVYWVWARDRSALMRPPARRGTGTVRVTFRTAKPDSTWPRQGARCSERFARPSTRFATPSTRRTTKFTTPSTRCAGAFARPTTTTMRTEPRRRPAECPRARGCRRASGADRARNAGDRGPGRAAGSARASRSRLVAASQARPEPTAIRHRRRSEPETLDGQISATPERAAEQARKDLRQRRHRLARSRCSQLVDASGAADRLDRSETQSSKTVPEKNYGPMYITHLTLDKSPERRARLIKVYNHELVGRRLVNLGGSLAFILICLAAVSGYIRADEATKGYYTNRLRMLAAAGVGAGGVLIYQMVT